MKMIKVTYHTHRRFKPCYKWNTFNTEDHYPLLERIVGFKPCYKWNTFNTMYAYSERNVVEVVLNLVISGIPSIL